MTLLVHPCTPDLEGNSHFSQRTHARDGSMGNSIKARVARASWYGRVMHVVGSQACVRYANATVGERRYPEPVKEGRKEG